ncbi:MAG: GNVR domain-containing protein [Methylocella sp.]
MLKVAMPAQSPDYDAYPAVEEESALSVIDALGFLRRQRFVIAGIFLLTVALALIYCFTAVPKYTGTAFVMIDSRKVKLLEKESIRGEGAMDSPAIDSQLEVIKSDSTILSVIKKLRLTEDPDFVHPPRGPIGTVTGFIGGLFYSPPPASKYQIERQVIDLFRSSLGVRRLGLTYVLQIDFLWLDPEKAARIANAVADAYISDELQSKYEASRRAISWLQDRIKELRDQSLAADRAVQHFKAENNIVDTGKGLMVDQQLIELDSQLSIARQQVAEAKARLDRMNEVVNSDVPDMNVAEALKNDVITHLRLQYTDLAKREAYLSAKLGKDHLAVVNIRNEMRDIQHNIMGELRQIAETYKSDYQIAVARESATQKEVDDLVAKSNATSNSQVVLRQLQSSAQSSRTLYDTFLQRFMETTQQESFPITDARILTAAQPPFGPSRPRKMLIIPGACFAGLMLGCLAGYVRERLDRVFRTSAQIEKLLHVEPLGVLPKLPDSVFGQKSKPTAPPARLPIAASQATLDEDLGEYRYVLNEPFSRFSETLRNIKVAADVTGIARRMKIIGVVSSLPREGKTFVASNLAQLIAHAGQKCVLVDGDLRNPSLTKSIAPRATVGLIEVVSGKATFDEVVWTDPLTGLNMVPAVVQSRISHTNEILSSNGMKAFLENLRSFADYVVIDLPPLALVTDVRAAGHLFDGFIFVIEWGHTSSDVVVEVLNAAQVVQEKMLGCVLNKANIAIMRNYENRTREYYEHKYYSPDGYTASIGPSDGKRQRVHAITERISHYLFDDRFG